MIDHVRGMFPHLGIAVYAYDPKGPVTVEVFTPDGTTMKRQAPTEAEALIAIFGPDIFTQEEEPQDELPRNAAIQTERRDDSGTVGTLPYPDDDIFG